MQVVCDATGSVLPQVRLADNPWTRLRGLIGRPRLQRGEGLWITPCNSVHMFFMRQSIRAAYIAADGRVLRVVHLRPWRIGPLLRRARSVLEIPPDEDRIREGDVVQLQRGPR